MKITEICVERPVLAWMIMAAAVVFGTVAATRIGISQMPDVDFPTISVTVNWEGASPEVIEGDVVDIVEEALAQVEGVRSITSSSKQNQASITLELDLSRNVDLALQDVQTKVAQAAQRLPKNMDPPVIAKTNPEDQPIMWVALFGPYSPQMLADYARYEVKERFQTAPGVGEVIMGGYLERNVRVWLDAEQLDARALTVTDVLRALQLQHVELPAGQITADTREVNVRVLGEALDLDTFRQIVVGKAGVSPVYLRDVALVEDGFEDVRRLARVAGLPSQGIGVKKQRGSNAVEVAGNIRKVLSEIQKTLPEGMKAEVVFDTTQFIKESVHEVNLELLLAVALTALVCWMFLGSISSTLNVILAIPMSLLGTIAIIYFLGFTLNMFTLLALSLSIGIVVDDAIMVLENIVRHSEEGKDRTRAALEGTREIAFAALAATLAVVAIFLPVVFMKGIMGKFFLQFGITLSASVLLSYVEAVTLAPARCAQILNTSREGRSRMGRFVDEAFEKLALRYAKLLEMGLRRPGRILLIGAVLFTLSIVAFKNLPGEFVPSQDQSRLLIRFQTAVGSSLEETNRIMRRAEEFMNGRPEVKRAFTVIGGSGGAGVNTGLQFITLVPPAEREFSQGAYAAVYRKEFNSYPGLKAVVQDLSQQGFTAQRGFPVEFSVRGGDWNTLVQVSQDLLGKLRESGLVVDLDSDYQLGMPELRILPDRARAADLGVSMEDIATTLNALVGGVKAGKYSTGGRRIDVRLKLVAAQRSRPEDLARLKVRTASGDLIPLSSLVVQKEVPALQAIMRRDRERAISIFANVAPGHSQDEALALVEKIGKDVPPGYKAVLGGASVAFRESMGSLLFALLLGIAVAYMVLASQFNSFLHPVTVLTILPLSIVGAAFALLITGKTLNIFSMIGLLLLLGIVKKNSIILVDYANQLRREGGLSAREAVLRAGPVRLRPILMTSVATLMAAVPSALGLGAGSELRTPMAIAVIGGLIVSTALSLLVVPAFYITADSGKARLSGWIGRLRGKPVPDGASVPPPP